MKKSHQSALDHLSLIAEIRALLENADYAGLKRIDAPESLESFLTGMFSYRPQLIRLLYRLRAPLVRLLGFKQDAMPEMDEWLPDDFPMFPCESVWFFTVRYVEKDHYWIAGCPRDRHLDADLAVVAEPLSDGTHRFYILTVVRYKHWTGPVYFNMIRLFNLLLVNRMTRFAAGQYHRS
jgi:Txe/YoeB family toxin of Txe-Axe toxin-antitoxin module